MEDWWDDDQLSDGDDIDTWMAKRSSDAARLNDPESDLLGRDAWAASTQAGQNLPAPTPSDVRALGAQIACAPNLPVAGGEFLPRVVAAGRGLEDAIAFGHGDDIEAGVRSIPTLLAGDPVEPRFHQYMQEANDQDRYDQTHYPLSRMTGEAVGTGLALVGTDGAAGAMVPRFTTAATRGLQAMTNLGRVRLGLAGAALGAAGQGATSVISGRPSELSDYASAALGGATMAMSGGRLRPVPAAALGAGVASTTDGLLHGQIDPTSVEHSMVSAGYLGGGGQIAGERGSNALDFRDKGRLGEALSNARSFFEANPVTDTQVVRTLPNGRRTVLDSVLTKGPVDTVESKFGPYAKLSKNQRAYQEQNPGRLRVDYWMPSHVCKISGAALSIFGSPEPDWTDPKFQIAPFQ